ncbi:unnamed protein product [Hymenolepis diminuta]|uniref:Uncharacterized protein n=1 Tax=Hymenolepis diminuta TaxID=6216 RepID=A0A564YNW4_HYMDI|nr:unnamed protein product [Hymenolepis diminuta]
MKEIRQAQWHQQQRKHSDNCENDVVNKKIYRRWFSAGGFEKDDLSLKDGPRAGWPKNSILSNCELPLMKIQLALPED